MDLTKSFSSQQQVTAFDLLESQLLLMEANGMEEHQTSAQRLGGGITYRVHTHKDKQESAMPLHLLHLRAYQRNSRKVARWRRPGSQQLQCAELFHVIKEPVSASSIHRDGEREQSFAMERIMDEENGQNGAHR